MIKVNKKYKIEKEKLEEIIKVRKETKNKKEDRRLQAIELRILGYTNEEIVNILQVNQRTIIKWIKLYLEKGTQALLILKLNRII